MEKLTGFVQPRQFGALVIGGAAGMVGWELFANFAAPLLMGGPLQPTALIASLFGNLFGVIPPWSVREVLHILTGIVFYPLFYLALRRAGPGFGRLGGAVMLGVVTWVLAIGVFVSLAGLPFMLGFTKITWVSLLGHLVYGFGTVFVFETLERTRYVRDLAYSSSR